MIEKSVNIEDLIFFGKVNASISHELKNIFAIISETTGFLNDLIQLSRQGTSFDLSTLESCNSSIAEEIQRGFHTIRQMNQFAHTVDEPAANIDVVNSLTLAVKLTAFLSNAKPVHMISPGTDILITTSPFALQKLWYHVLKTVYAAIETGDVHVRFSFAEIDTVQIIFSASAPMPFSDTAPDELTEYAKAIGGSITINSNPFELQVSILQNS